MRRLPQRAQPRFALLCLLLTLMTSACSWHLREADSLPVAIKVVYLDHNITQKLSLALSQELSLRGALVVSDATDALITLKQVDFDIERRTLTVNADSKVAEYELVGIAALSALNAQQNLVIQAEAHRHFLNDTSRVLATQFEESRQRTLIIQELARQLVDQLTQLPDSEP